MAQEPPQFGDRDLARLIYEGDKRAETELVERFSRSLFLILRRRLDDFGAAQDLLQETLLIAVKRLREKPLDNPEKIENYIHRIAINLIRNDQRKSARRATDPDSDFIEVLPSDFGQPEPEAQLLQQQIAVRELLSELRVKRDKEILFRFYIDQQDKNEICSALNLTSRHFDRVLLRAKQRFRMLVNQRESAL